MNPFKHTAVTAVMAMALTAGGAQAALLDIVTTDDSIAAALPLGAAHDVAETQGAQGWYNANLMATDNVQLTFEYLGAEAGWTNTFIVDGDEVFWNKAINGNAASSAGDQVLSSAASAELIDFAFAVLKGTNAGYGVSNGSNNDPYSANPAGNGKGNPNFFLGYADDSGDSVYITFDDGGGAIWPNDGWDDDNHDDLVIKLTAVSIPEPGSIALMAIGLICLGLARRRALA